MLIMDAVLETYEARGCALWPVSDPADERLLRLSGDLSPRQVGTAMAVLAGYNNRPRERGGRRTEDGLAQLNRLLTAECVVAPGGLRVTDTDTGVTAEPGCCFGLENWRDWQGLLDGEEPWLGHDCEPRVEHVGAIIRLWPDADRQERRPIEIPRVELPGLLGSVQDDLSGFLKSVEGWASCRFTPVTAALVATLDEGLTVSAPLGDSP
ncbi:hypothetical protein AB0I94_13960 [Streptomyces sp. NPDC050147]|uniref:hypothetical protein n=1 Tax=Streptomyces sp. NPDC050147 TaxID=3155513 RepID=UPI0034258E00